jgi:hypothetical protein
MPRILTATRALAVVAMLSGCTRAPTAPNEIQRTAPKFSGAGLGSGHFIDQPTQTTATSLETAVQADSASRTGPGLGSGH